MLDSGDAVDHGLAGTSVSAETMMVTCALDSRSHAVPDYEVTKAALDTGRFSALCGHVIAAAPLASPDGEPCIQCVELKRPAVPRRVRGLRRLL